MGGQLRRDGAKQRTGVYFEMLFNPGDPQKYFHPKHSKNF